MTWSVRAVGAVAAVLLVASCGNGSDETGTRPRSVAPSTESSPFEVGTVPAGFELVVAGAGTNEPTWDSDSFGSTPRFTVLQPTEERHDRIGTVVVSASGYVDNQGGLDQAAPGYGDRWSGESVTIDGQEAIYTYDKKSERPRQSALTVVRGDNLQVTVEADHATRDELEQVSVRAAPPPDQHRAPTVADPPLGLTVVGSVDADCVLAFGAYGVPGLDAVPGPTTAHSIGWSSNDADLVAMSIPGRSIDLDAIAARPGALGYPHDRSVERREVDGRPALVLTERREDMESRPVLSRRTVATERLDGDVLVVSTTSTSTSTGRSGDPDLPSVDQLIDVAGSVRTVSADRWDAIVERAGGGPGFHADAGQTELASGERNGTGWILQDDPGPATRGLLSGSVSASGGEPVVREVSPCLKLSDGDRPCTISGTGDLGPPVTFLSWGEAATVGRFLMVETEVPGTRVRVTSAGGKTESPLARAVESERGVAVVFLDGAAPGSTASTSQPPEGPATVPASPLIPDCSGQAVGPKQVRVEVVAADGAATCVGASR